MPAMTEILTLDVSIEGGSDVLRAQGEIDLATAPMLEARLGELQTGRPVVLDLTSVNFIDSTGLRVILGADARASEQGTSLAIVAVDGPVTRLFDITGVSGRLTVFDSVTAAAANE